MIWTAAGLFCGLAVLFRLITRRGRHQIWWTCATAAPATSTAAGVILGNEYQIGELLHAPNVAVLLAGLFSVVGCAFTLIFWHAVRTKTPNPLVMRLYAAVAGLIGLAMVGLWLLAPVHTYAYSSFRAVPLSPQLVAYALLFQTYFGACHAYAGIAAYRLLKTPPEHDPGLRDPAIRVALLLVLPATALTAAGQALGLIRLLFQTASPEAAARVVSTADLCTLAAMAIYGVSGLTALAGPRVEAAIRYRRLIASLDPLWRRVRELYPTVALPTAHLSDRADVKAGRMLIEIGDGLAQLRVAPGYHDPVAAVAHALAGLHAAPRTEPATLGLPTLGTAREEEELFLAIADAYVTSSAASSSASDRCSE